MVERRLAEDKQWIDAVVAMARTLKKLEEEGVFTVSPVQVSEALSSLNRIATALGGIESYLLSRI